MVATLKHTDRRKCEYLYGEGENLDGKIEIYANLFNAGDMDIVEALFNGDISIKESSACKAWINLPGLRIDEKALTLATRILAEYDAKKTFPEKMEV